MLPTTLPANPPDAIDIGTGLPVRGLAPPRGRGRRSVPIRPAGRLAAAFSLACLWLVAPVLRAADWPQFRGPGGSGVAVDGDIPLSFGPESNVAWKLPLPPGHSSPCISGDSIFLTGFSAGELVTLAIDRHTGRVRWTRGVTPGAIERGSELGSPAASTPAADQESVFVYFGPFGLIAYGHDGVERWRKALPTPVTQHGASTSPVLAGKRLVLACDQDIDSYLLAVDRRSGETLWKTPRPGFRRGFSTPLLWPAEQPREVVLAGTLRLVAYDLERGAESWQVRGLPNEMVSTPVSGEGLIFVCGWTYGSGVSQMPAFDALLREGDKDGDSQLTRDEAPVGPAKQHFTYIDADKDGKITRGEWDTMAEIFSASQNALIAVRPAAGADGGAPGPGSGPAAGADAPGAEVVWKQDRGLPYVPSPLLYQGRIFIVKNGGIASCFDARTGAVDYLQQRVGALGNFYASPIAAAGKILVASQQGVLVVLRSGPTLEALARIDLAEELLATPAIVGERLYVRTGQHLWCFAEPGPARAPAPAQPPPAPGKQQRSFRRSRRSRRVHGPVRSQQPAASSQTPEARGQRPEARGQRPEARGQRPEARGQRPEARGQRCEV